MARFREPQKHSRFPIGQQSRHPRQERVSIRVVGLPWRLKLPNQLRYLPQKRRTHHLQQSKSDSKTNNRKSRNLLANPSPLQKHIRTDIATTSSPDSPSLAQQLQTKSAEARAQEAEQYLQFVQQQRLYSTLVERYNPGMDMSDEERVRLTAKRVGMELPIEAMMGGKKE